MRSFNILVTYLDLCLISTVYKDTIYFHVKSNLSGAVYVTTEY